MQATRKSRFVGSLLGCTCGDVLGSAVEMQTREQILQHYPDLLRDFQPAERSIGFGCYTDDTEMTLALARSILRYRGVDGAECAAAYAEAFTPERGYGRSAIKILEALQQGADWRTSGTLLFADGSFGNGGAMRIAPVGLLYGHGDYLLLYEKVKAAIWMTHTHAEAIDAALLQARAIGLLLTAGQVPDWRQIIGQLLWYVPESILNSSLQQLSGLLERDASADEVVSTFGCGVRSADSWPAALWAALRYIDNPQAAIVQAVNLGGDTDTIGAMTGALVGALHGDEWIPRSWFDQLENGGNGRDELIAVAERLAAISVR
ncbi:ADP-ribosylglycohydrolase [Malonomonas rubra DSM 5091]|uniref:ADP-ribosylglycohydrolase n=1 Tax=Malonomonas rubra DSM 5091 TaxID=1122189 RepID=A0A1M6CC93_MALRU|nr:ADP-ribosylglycohydrolase family protein [Malonomonas rubra]SHI58665.1 ADP-ribosylglycohydrolase [Malonomonas rubra DSM 5091]